MVFFCSRLPFASVDSLILPIVLLFPGFADAMCNTAQDGLPEVWERLKAVINTWKALKSLTDFQLTNDHEILEANFRKELLRRIRPLTSMCSPLSSDRPVSSAPQVGIEPRLLGGVIDVLADNFPPAGQRGSVSDQGMAASYAFRLCGDEWSVDLTSNRHWVKIFLCYKGSKSSVERITSVWFRRDGEGATCTHAYAHTHTYTHTHTHTRIHTHITKQHVHTHVHTHTHTSEKPMQQNRSRGVPICDNIRGRIDFEIRFVLLHGRLRIMYGWTTAYCMYVNLHIYVYMNYAY